MDIKVRNIFQKYQEFITSSAQLALCEHAQSVGQFLRQLKCLWQLEFVTDDQLLSALNQCNQQLLEIDSQQLGGIWLPYRYRAKTRSIQWCLPLGHATEPFHDQYIERCRQQSVINQLINPKTSIQTLLFSSVIDKSCSPAGFIFHLSRCGSTLISGCLAELDSTCVLSESPLLTEILLDFSLTNNEKQQLLPQLIHLQGCLFAERDRIVVKWNAWDVMSWSIIHADFPQVPVVLLVREPIEILASHQRMAGRHMAGDPSLTGLNPVFTALASTETVLDVRIRVLHALLDGMSKIVSRPNVMLVNYASLNCEKMHKVSQHFELRVTDELTRFERRMQFHSKDSGQFFQADSVKKRHMLSADEQEKITNSLMPTYEQLLSKNITGDAVHVE